VEEEAHAPPEAQAPSHACALEIGVALPARAASGRRSSAAVLASASVWRLFGGESSGSRPHVASPVRLSARDSPPPLVETVRSLCLFSTPQTPSEDYLCGRPRVA
jgi:hypothetical protein